jgi:hypothetical protein
MSGVTRLLPCCSSDKMDSPCTPRTGKTGLIVGQDYSSILNYTNVVTSGNCPFAVMSYISLALHNGTIPGLVNATDYGSGVEWTKGLNRACKQSAVQLAIYMVGYYSDIPRGTYDPGISLLATFVKEQSNQFYIRIGYEFDSTSNRYDGLPYREAFRYVVDYFRDHEVTNAAFVWHASGFPPKDELPYTEWFPGVDVVDWCGISLFQQPYHCGERADCATMQYADSFAKLCTSLDKPIMIAESTPFGGIVDFTERSEPSTITSSNRAGFDGDSWSQWFVPVLSYIERHDVRLWSYINCNWDSQPMWQKEHAPGVHWGDTRIEGMQLILDGLMCTTLA